MVVMDYRSVSDIVVVSTDLPFNNAMSITDDRSSGDIVVISTDWAVGEDDMVV